jgi:hypothetical protein
MILPFPRSRRLSLNVERIPGSARRGGLFGVWQNFLASPAPDPPRELASFGAVVLGIIRRFTQFANGFVAHVPNWAGEQ